MAGVQDQKLARPLRHDAATYRRCRRLMGGRELDGRKLDGAKKVKGPQKFGRVLGPRTLA